VFSLSSIKLYGMLNIMLTRRQLFHMLLLPLIKMPDGILVGGWYQQNILDCSDFSPVPQKAKGIYTYAYIDASQEWVSDFYQSTRELFECEKSFFPLVFGD
jgi:hypothetical protein